MSVWQWRVAQLHTVLVFCIPLLQQKSTISNAPSNKFNLIASEVWTDSLYAMYRGAYTSLARPGRKEATTTKISLLQATQKKIQKVVGPTSSPRQQWPPRRTKIGDLSIVFFSRVGLRTYQHPCIFILFCYECWVGSEIPIYTARFSCRLPALIYNFPPKRSPLIIKMSLQCSPPMQNSVKFKT